MTHLRLLIFEVSIQSVSVRSDIIRIIKIALYWPYYYRLQKYTKTKKNPTLKSGIIILHILSYEVCWVVVVVILTVIRQYFDMQITYDQN